MNSKLIRNTVAVVAISFMGLSGCSTFKNVGKSARNLTNFGSQRQNEKVAVNEELIIPPSLKTPASVVGKQRVSRSYVRKQANGSSRRVQRSTKNYYIVVGTYPDQQQALDTFVRLSSIGLPGATMESRATRSGKVLHMVRLGPYTKQAEIDKVKDNLTSDGLSQFKVVED